jgi:hypothetical protein
MSPPYVRRSTAVEDPGRPAVATMPWLIQTTRVEMPIRVEPCVERTTVTLAVQPDEQVQDVVAGLVDAARWLVQEKEARVAMSAREGALLLTAR